MKSILLHLFLQCLVKAIDFEIWELFDADAMYLTIHDTSIWKLIEISPAEPNPFPIRSQTAPSSAWTPQDGYCTTLSLAATYCYCYNFQQRAFRKVYDPAITWFDITGYTGDVVDLKAGTSGHVWFVSTTPHTDGYKLFQLDAASLARTEITGTGAVKVGPTPNNLAWVVTITGDIKRMLATNVWETMPGKARDIFVGSDGIPYIVSNVTVDKGYEIKKWNALENKWDTLAGIAGTTLALDKNNNPYIITTDKKAYRQKGIIYDFCPICHINCNLCSDAETCKACRTTVCKSDNTCIRCKTGEYASQANQGCMPCPSSCETCSSANNCEFCKAGYGLQSGLCDVCPYGTYLDGDTCSSCPGTCATCADAVTCDFCHPGYAIENGICVSCPVGNYIQGTACFACPENCTMCTGANACSQCKRGFGLLNGECITCASDQHLAGSICRDCSENCLSCRGQDSCLVCKEGFALVNGLCKLCDEGTVLTDGICKELKPFITGEVILSIILGSITTATSLALLGRKAYKKWKSSRNETNQNEENEQSEQNEHVSFAASERAEIQKGEYSDVSVLSLPP